METRIQRVEALEAFRDAVNKRVAVWRAAAGLTTALALLIVATQFAAAQHPVPPAVPPGQQPAPPPATAPVEKRLAALEAAVATQGMQLAKETAALTALQAALAKETTARMALEASLAAESAARQAAETAIQNQLKPIAEKLAPISRAGNSWSSPASTCAS